MKTSTLYFLLANLLTPALFFVLGCRDDNNSSQFGTNAPHATVNQSTQSENGFNEETYEKAKNEAMTASEGAYEARKQGAPLPPSQFHFPNTFDPEQPIPNYLNFYGINDRYPTYLLCEFRVNKSEYNPSDESGWFRTSLEQVRQSGQANFPPVQWIAVIIINRAEWNDASTFEQSHKVGAIFKAIDIFNPSCKLSQLIAQANLDRHPFKYDTSQLTPVDQQRWLIVERHATTNHIVDK